jgi:hypothetical protein
MSSGILKLNSVHAHVSVCISRLPPSKLPSFLHPFPAPHFLMPFSLVSLSRPFYLSIRSHSTPVRFFLTLKQNVPLISCPTDTQLSWYVLAEAGFLCSGKR